MIVVTGATGGLGRLVVANLLGRVPAGDIVAAVRTPSKAADLASQGVHVREADYGRPATLASAFAGATRVLLISSPSLGVRVAEHAAVIDAAKAAGVRLLAYTSVLRADTSTLLVAPDHVATERYLAGSGVPWVLLRNGWYLENRTAAIAAALDAGALLGCAGEGRIAAAARADYAEAAAAVLTTDGHVGRTYELGGDAAFTLAELAAQVDLVRVLTHEVMNSLTPVTSLAATASRLVGGLDAAAVPGLADARVAINALARRAADLERFVTSYKGFSEAPALHRATIPVGPWFAELAELFGTTPAARGVALFWRVADGTPAIDGDAALLTQVMLNLLKNAGEAVVGLADPAITVSAEPALDGRVKIAVTDTGPGIPPALARDVFLPFFTTKPNGTGIGLSFARQIVMLHGGQIGVAATGGCLEALLPASPFGEK